MKQYDNGPENDNVSDENEATLDDRSNESSDEEPEDTTATRGRAAQRGRGMRARGRGTGRGRAAVTRRGRGCGRGRAGGTNKQTPEDLYKWLVVDEGTRVV